MDFDNVDKKTAFKLGFLSYCAEQGMSKEAAEILVKRAWWWSVGPGLRSLAGTIAGMATWDAGKKLLGGAGRVGQEVLKADWMIPPALGLIGGAGLGWGAAKLNEPDITPEEIQAKELSDTYKRYTERLKARRAYQQYRAARQMN